MHFVRLGLFFSLVVVCAITDLWKGKVYDWATLPGIALGLLLGFLLGNRAEGGMTFESSLLGLAVGFGTLFLAFLGRGVGGGDVKLAGAFGALGGFPFIIYALFFGTLFGAVMGIGRLIWRGQFWGGLRDMLRYLFSLKKRTAPSAEGEPASPGALTIPYGTALSIGAAWSWVLLSLQS